MPAFGDSMRAILNCLVLRGKRKKMSFEICTILQTSTKDEIGQFRNVGKAIMFLLSDWQEGRTHLYGLPFAQDATYSHQISRGLPKWNKYDYYYSTFVLNLYLYKVSH